MRSGDLVCTLADVKRRSKQILGGLATVAALAFAADLTWSLMTRVAEPTFTVQTHDHEFEVRAYAPRVLAETTVSGRWDAVGNEGFRRLAGYIFGQNVARSKIAMTAPVGQRPEGRTLAMTAPVGQRPEGDAWVVSFTMPAGETLSSLPHPNDSRVTLRALAATRVAVVRFSGRWSDARMVERTRALRDWAVARGLALVGEPEVNRYNPPWTLWFLRRNEVWLALAPAAG